MSSYLTKDTAETYLDRIINTSVWDNASDADKTAALAWATEIIDNLNYVGEANSEANQFPRDGDAEVPDDIYYACVYIAIALLDGMNPDYEYENLSIQVHTIGNVKTQRDTLLAQAHVVAGVPSRRAWTLLVPYLRNPNVLELRNV